MESVKDKLVNNIKEWIQMDNEIIQLNNLSIVMVFE